MFKRVWFALLITAFTLFFFACGGGKEDVSEEESETMTAAKTAAPSTASAAPAAGGATLTGKVAFVGTTPGKEQLKMEADAFCKAAHSQPVYSQDVAVNSNGTLQWVLVYVKEGASGNYPAPTQPVTLDQKGCQYSPHIFGIQVGQPLRILNSDGTLHNIHALPKLNAEFNIGQPFQKMETIKKFDKPEVPLRFKCDVHKWMGAYCGVFNHPFFAVSNDQGSFEIKGLPPGNYLIEAWQEKFGPQTQNVTVAGGETKSVEFTFKG